jgi:O-acetyl-ADP-ribose deacetylase (regulator of RNase III)
MKELRVPLAGGGGCGGGGGGGDGVAFAEPALAFSYASDESVEAYGGAYRGLRGGASFYPQTVVATRTLNLVSAFLPVAVEHAAAWVSSETERRTLTAVAAVLDTAKRLHCSSVATPLVVAPPWCVDPEEVGEILTPTPTASTLPAGMRFGL